jgi:phosphatidyl-myo-inositol alpha-mannosyltransferase
VRIALLHPSYWPEVRRGGERLVHDVAAGLSREGHDVTILTSHRARTATTVEEGVTVVRAYRPPTAPLHARGFEYHLTNMPSAALRARTGGFDVAHAFFLPDARAAVAARRVGGPPVVYTFTGIATREWLHARRLRERMARHSVRRAEAVTVLSRAAAGPFREHLGREPEVIAPGVLTDRFAVDVPRAAEPTLLCAASLDDPRKRGPLLLEAFARLRRRRPEARLVLAGPGDPTQGAGELALPEGASRIEVTGDPELARAYAGAWATVLPAVHEAFGLVVAESLAAGTPAVGARSGALPELLGDERVGVLFDPDDADGLAAAMEAALDLGERPETAAACREHAAAWDVAESVRSYEDLYARARG